MATAGLDERQSANAVTSFCDPSDRLAIAVNSIVRLLTRISRSRSIVIMKTVGSLRETAVPAGAVGDLLLPPQATVTRPTRINDTLGDVRAWRDRLFFIVLR